MDADELIVEEVPVQGTKVAIDDDDDSVEEVPVKTGGTKVAIEDSSEDEENLLVAETVPESLKPDPPSQGVKVAIEDDDDDDEPPPPDVSPAKSSTALGRWGNAQGRNLKGEGNELMKQGDVSGAGEVLGPEPTRSTTRGPTGPWPAYAWATWKALFGCRRRRQHADGERMSQSASRLYARASAATRASASRRPRQRLEGQSCGIGRRLFARFR